MSKHDLAKLAFELSEKRLSSQQTSALAADSRAMSFAATVLAAAAILAGLSENVAVPTAMLAGALCMVGSAALAGYSARPTPFYMPGAKCSDVLEDLEEDAELVDVLKEMGGYNDLNSVENDKLLRKNSSLMKWSFTLSICGVLIAAVPQALSVGSVKAEASIGNAGIAQFARLFR